MSKPTRAAVGAVVDRSAQTLSQTLLADEHRARLGMEEQFITGLAVARPALRTIYSQGLSRALAAGRSAMFDQLMSAVVAATYQDVQQLLTVAAGRAVDAIVGELQAIESNLGRKYDGLAEVSADAARQSSASYVDDQLQVWIDDAAAAVVWFSDLVEADWRAAVQFGETVEDVDRRMFSAEPVRLPGHGGQGTWWRPFGSVFAAAKAQEFIVVNQIRARAVQEFNVAGVALRDG